MAGTTPYAKLVATIIVVLLGVAGLLLLTKVVPQGELWLLAITVGAFSFWACSKQGWLVFILIPLFPFIVIASELERGGAGHYPFTVFLAAWSVFTLIAVAGAWRWWNKHGNT